MSENPRKTIRIQGAFAHNLQRVSLEIPHHQLIVVTGVSGSGKSSLAFDVVAREGQRRYLETFPGFSRTFMDKLARPDVEAISGLFPVISLSQKAGQANPRSTVGTLSDLYDHLRLVFARLTTTTDSGEKLSRSHFSFNSPKGACPTCSGLGLEEKISLRKLVADPARTLREGALAPTLPNGYIMYSQVTIDVLNTVCEAHGFSVNIPWEDLTEEQKQVVLYGSDRLKVPFGKHSLESRLKWTGITAKPREEGFYKGMMPIMTDILRRDRNKNILRYAESLVCSDCAGSRLNSVARTREWNGKTIVELSRMELQTLGEWLESQSWASGAAAIADEIVPAMLRQIAMLKDLGVGYLHLLRPAASLSAGEFQRIRLVNQVGATLSHVLYVLDEPSIGLHPRDNAQMLRILRELVNQGNTVMVVEHDEATIRSADWIVEIGPQAGINGGEVLFSGSAAAFAKRDDLAGVSPTWELLYGDIPAQKPSNRATDNDTFVELKGCRHHNLQSIDARFLVGGLNVVTGVAGAGKGSLVTGCLEYAVNQNMAEATLDPLRLQSAEGLANWDGIISIDQKPIGRTPRSNPATYTGLADKIRDVFAKTPEAKAEKWKKSRFSFNTKGGRCENCQGAGRLELGMHLLGKIEYPCPVCNGKRFDAETLEVKFQGKSIFEVFEMRISEAVDFFESVPAIQKYVSVLAQLGLGYIQLGQPSTSLSGGEAQRIKLAAHLLQKRAGRTLFIFHEPTIGLHGADVNVLLSALRELCEQGNTVVCIEHDEKVIRAADWVIDLGPESGNQGGKICYQGSGFLDASNSLTADYLRMPNPILSEGNPPPIPPDTITLKGVTTHLLKSVSVAFPRNKMTVVAGVSGSGKSSLVFDTLVAEAQSRFTESLSTYARSLLKNTHSAAFESCTGLGPVVAIGRAYIQPSPRSNVGTLTGLDAHFRLLYARIAQSQGLEMSASDFSFNHQTGACPVCEGLGQAWQCNSGALIAHPSASIMDGAFSENRVAQFYGDPHGKYIAILKTVAAARNWDIEQSWEDLPAEVQQAILYGEDDTEWQVSWHFKNKTRSGTQELTAKWPGFCTYIEDEFLRKQQNKNTAALRALMHQVPCESCHGNRLRPEMLQFTCKGMSIAELSQLEIGACRSFFAEGPSADMQQAEKIIFQEVSLPVLALLESARKLQLDYLSPARTADSLSGGEGQRVRLLSAFSASLYGVIYVLDEPTMGLHPRNIGNLIEVLKELVEAGNTMVLVEHNPAVIQSADHIIEMGPGAGMYGGEVIASGSLESVVGKVNSQLSKWLENRMIGRRLVKEYKKDAFGVKSAQKHTLSGLEIAFLSGGFIALTGVSGSGKSTLMREVIWPSAKSGAPVNCRETFGLDTFSQVLLMEQKPFRGTASSSVATQSGMMDPLRAAFAALPAAKAAGHKKAHFSYLDKKGGCPDCKGAGRKVAALDFAGDLCSVCDTCKGMRYQPEILEIEKEGYNIGEILQLTLQELHAVAHNWKGVGSITAQLCELGLGHLRAGQPTNTLSGGEAQRMHLAGSLLATKGAQNLYLFDEPTTGLHFEDIENLVQVFHKMLSQGHTILCIAHNAQLIEYAHQVIEMGPGGGKAGGKIVRNEYR